MAQRKPVNANPEPFVEGLVVVNPSAPDFSIKPRPTVADFLSWMRQSFGDVVEDGRVQVGSSSHDHAQFILRTEQNLFVVKINAKLGDITVTATSAGLGTPGSGIREGGEEISGPLNLENWVKCVGWMMSVSLLHAPGALARKQALREDAERQVKIEQLREVGALE